MGHEYILFEKDVESNIACITLNRPEKLNAMSLAMYDEVNRLVREVDVDDEVKVLIFKGAGRCFCSGFDVMELGHIHKQGTGKEGERRPSQRDRIATDRDHIWGRPGLYQTIFHCRKATIAQVHGYCYGAGIEIALVCDITLATEDALFTHPGWRYIGPTGDIALFIQTMGVKKTKEMMLTGIPLDAREAHRVGFVNKVVPTLKELEEETSKMAEAIALLPFDGIVMGKAHFEAALDALGNGTGSTLSYLMHVLQTNIRYEPNEFNLFRERRDKGLKEALYERDRRFGGPYRL